MFNDFVNKAKSFLTQAQLKTLQRAFKNDKENQAYAVDLLFAYMEDKDDPGYQNWRLLISELDVMIKEPENYEIYKLIFEIINPNQIRAISTDTRVPHLSYNYHYVNLNRDYVNQPIGLQLHTLRNSSPDSKYPSYVTELLFIKSLQAADSSQMSLAEACGIQIGDRIVEVNDLPMNNFSDFRDLMQRLTRTSDDIKMRIENIGFIPEPGTREMSNVTWEKVDNYQFKNCEVPIEGSEHIDRLNIKFCNPGIYVLMTSRDDKTKTTARIGDKITEINGVRTNYMTQGMFEAQMIKGAQKIYYVESSAVEIDNLYLQLSQPGRNWNQAELAALKRRQAKLYRREIRETRLNHLKRNTQRYTEVSSFGGSDCEISDGEDDMFVVDDAFDPDNQRISGDSVVDEFYTIIDEQNRNQYDSLQTDLSPDTSVSTSGVSPIPPIIPKEDSGNSSARSSVTELLELDEDDDIDLSKLTVEERKRLPAAVVLNHMLKHGGITEDGLKLIKDKENLEDAEKLLSDIEKYKQIAGPGQANNVAIVIPPKKQIKQPEIIHEEPLPETKQNKMQLRFLKMLRENENKFQTLRVSVPRQIRQNIWKNKKSKALKLSMENEIDIIFGVDPSSGLTMVKEVISTDVTIKQSIKHGDLVAKIRTLNPMEVNAKLRDVQTVFNNWRKCRTYDLNLILLSD